MATWTQAAADHVTEREAGTWEDCVPASGVEFARAGFNDRSIPATAAEREALRSAMGLPEEHKGATLAQLLAGLQKRYKVVGGARITRDWSELREHVLRTGTVAVVTGSMSLSSVGTHWRRWSPNFTGAHAVAVYGHTGASPTWCDPLAPHGTYRGEPVPIETLRGFFSGYSGAGALLAEVGGLMRDTMSVYLREMKTGTFVVPAGYTVNARKLTETGLVVAKTWPSQPTPSPTFQFTETLTRVGDDPVDVRLNTMLLAADDGGFFAGLYVSPAVVNEKYDPPPVDETPYSQADLDAAVASQRLTWTDWMSTSPKET